MFNSRNKLGTIFTVAALIVLGACGKADTVGKQESERDEIGPELQGVWISACEGSSIEKVTFAGDALTFNRVDYFDPECEEPIRDMSHKGTFKLSHNYKSGVNNSIVFVAGDAIDVTLFTDMEVDAQNDNVSRVQNEKEPETGGIVDPRARKMASREQRKLRSSKQIANWVRGGAKTLNKLQLEKFRGMGLSVSPAIELGTRTAIRYEIDNGFLQISGPTAFVRVFSKL